jgi:MoaA/NifB/PqqE/SkfB family radical SAM enzyme
MAGSTTTEQQPTRKRVPLSPALKARLDRHAENRDRIASYLEDPFLRYLWDEVQRAGNLRAISLDLTHICQLRCEGCYFFNEQMDSSKAPRDEAVFDAFIDSEKARGTNYITVLGGEPSLNLGRLKKLHDNFTILPVTNGIRRIPEDGFENMPIAISVWGDHEIDKMLRGGGKIDVFSRALKNYRGDRRAGWYFTVSTGNAHIMEGVVDEIVENGNYVYFSYYEDKVGLGGGFDDRAGFGEVRREIDRLIDIYPDRILTTSYVAKIATTDRLFDMRWGYDVCATVSGNYEKNHARLQNGQPYSPHFRAYMPDLKTLRRCPVGEDTDCSQCHNAYARHSWIMINRDLHLGSTQDFTNWLTSVYMFYLAGHMVDREQGLKLLPQIHERTRAARAEHEGIRS